MVPPSGGLIREKSLNTKLTRTVGKISIACDHCEMEYETYAAWAKRYSHHYCSMACKQAAMIDRVPAVCVVCGVTYYVTPVSLRKGAKTCSKECEHTNRVELTIRRHKNSEFPVAFGENASNVKLKEVEVLAILKDSRIHILIASDYGVTRELITAIKNKKIWKHLDAEA